MRGGLSTIFFSGQFWYHQESFSIVWTALKPFSTIRTDPRAKKGVPGFLQKHFHFLWLCSRSMQLCPQGQRGQIPFTFIKSLPLSSVSSWLGKLQHLEMIPLQQELFITDEIQLNMVNEMGSIRRREVHMRESLVHYRKDQDVSDLRKKTLIFNHIKGLLKVQSSAPSKTIYVNPNHPAGSKLLQSKRNQIPCTSCNIYFGSGELLKKHIETNHMSRTGLYGLADQKGVSEANTLSNSENMNLQQADKHVEKSGMTKQNFNRDIMFFEWL